MKNHNDGNDLTTIGTSLNVSVAKGYRFRERTQMSQASADKR